MSLPGAQPPRATTDTGSHAPGSPEGGRLCLDTAWDAWGNKFGQSLQGLRTAGPAQGHPPGPQEVTPQALSPKATEKPSSCTGRLRRRELMRQEALSAQGWPASDRPPGRYQQD